MQRSSIRAFFFDRWPLVVVALVLAIEIALVAGIDRRLSKENRLRATAHAEARIKEEIELRFQQGVLVLHLNQYEHAVTAFHRVLELDPQLPEAHVNLGFALLGLKKHKEAHDFFTGALALRPEQLNARYGAALALHGMGRLDDAIAEMHTYLILIAPEDPYRAKAETFLKAWRAEHAAQAKSAKKPARKSSPAGRHDGS